MDIMMPRLASAGRLCMCPRSRYRSDLDLHRLHCNPIPPVLTEWILFSRTQHGYVNPCPGVTLLPFPTKITVAIHAYARARLALSSLHSSGLNPFLLHALGRLDQIMATTQALAGGVHCWTSILRY
jgi:hypothetical protein